MGSPELIFASYSWARRLHIARRTRTLPAKVFNAACISFLVARQRRPAASTFVVGMRRVIFSRSNSTTRNSSCSPAISWSWMALIWPTPWAGYTTKSPGRCLVAFDIVLFIPLMRSGMARNNLCRCALARRLMWRLARSRTHIRSISQNGPKSKPSVA